MCIGAWMDWPVRTTRPQPGHNTDTQTTQCVRVAGGGCLGYCHIAHLLLTLALQINMPAPGGTSMPISVADLSGSGGAVNMALLVTLPSGGGTGRRSLAASSGFEMGISVSITSNLKKLLSSLPKNISGALAAHMEAGW